MAFQVSPGVNVSEVDLTNIIPAVATSTGATVGTFTWGPTDTPILISSEEQLVNVFGKPKSNSTWTNQESFFTAANFLSYSNALYVTRVQGGTSNNASDSSASIQVGNRADFDATTLASDKIIAKYPGSRGNSLAISVCASANAYNSTHDFGSNVEWGVGTATGTGTALTTTNLEDNEWVKIGGNFYQIQSSNTTTITLKSKIKGTANVVAQTVQRYWEFYNLVDRAPQNSKFAADNGSSVIDEVHVVVFDEDGGLTGTKRTALEVFEGLSRATGAKAEDGTDINFTTAINNRSAWIYRGGVAVGEVTEGAVGTLSDGSASAVVEVSLNNGTDSASDGAQVVGEYATAWDKFKATDTYDVSMLIAGKANATLANYIIDNVADTRKDCMAFISPEKDDVVSGNQPVTSTTALSNVTTFRGTLNNTSYAALDSGYKYQYDKYNDAYVWVPLNADVAGLCARTDSERDPWFSPAGFTRGTVKNVVKLAFVPTKAERDELYKADVNPVVTFPGQGTVLYGDKTLLGRASAFDRINVRRLFIVLEKSISNAANALLFEFNDAITRAQFRNAVVPFLREVQGRRGITDFSVIADETNNTAEVIDANQFVGDIYIKPARSINFIQLNFVAVRSGVEFSEIVGAV